MTETVQPLPDEPLAIRLLNTTWSGDTGEVDLLDERADLARWLVSVGVATRATEEMRRALRSARHVIAAIAADPESAAARQALNALARARHHHPDDGRRRRSRENRHGRRVAASRVDGGRRSARHHHEPARSDPAVRPPALCAVVRRHVAQRQPSVVLDGGVRQPGQGPTALSPPPTLEHLTAQAESADVRTGVVDEEQRGVVLALVVAVGDDVHAQPARRLCGRNIVECGPDKEVGKSVGAKALAFG